MQQQQMKHDYEVAYLAGLDSAGRSAYELGFKHGLELGKKYALLDLDFAKQYARFMNKSTTHVEQRVEPHDSLQEEESPLPHELPQIKMEEEVASPPPSSQEFHEEMETTEPTEIVPSSSLQSSSKKRPRIVCQKATSEEMQCVVIIKRGSHKGERCQNEKIADSDLCEKCANEKEKDKQRKEENARKKMKKTESSSFDTVNQSSSQQLPIEIEDANENEFEDEPVFQKTASATSSNQFSAITSTKPRVLIGQKPVSQGKQEKVQGTVQGTAQQEYSQSEDEYENPTWNDNVS